MRKFGGILGLLVVFMLVMQLFSAVPALAEQPFEVCWGQDYTGDECGNTPGMVVFYHDAGITNYEFKLYKDNSEVYSIRIEEGMSNEGWLEEEPVFLAKFAEFGTGAYRFTVSSLDGDGWTIDEASIIETATSGVFNYVQPAQKLPEPVFVSNKNGVVDWEKSSDDTYAYFYDRDISYGGDITMDPDYTDSYCEDSWQSSYDIAEMEEYLDFLAEYNPEKYIRKNAKVKIRIRALPEDIREYQPSDYTEWITIVNEPSASGGGAVVGPGMGGDSSSVDRSSVCDEYYDAAKVIFDLGIMPEVYDMHDSVVTKGDFAVWFVKFLGLEDVADSMKNTVLCNDVEKGTELNGCINALYSSGFTILQDYATFGADIELLYEQVIKFLVQALGYEPVASTKGSYPAGYLAVAYSYGITNGVSLGIGSTVTAEQLSQLMYNSLDVGIMDVISLSPQYGNTYAVTDETQLYCLGYGKILCNLDISGDYGYASGMLYDKDNLKGLNIKNKKLTIGDDEIRDYPSKGMELYVKDNVIVSGIEYFGNKTVVNNGEKVSYTRMIPVDFEVYGYTKYKVDDGEYKTIPDKTDYVLIGEADGSYSFKITFANDDESKVSERTYSVTHDNKHTVTFMVGGKVHSTETVACGSAFAAPSDIAFEGYCFDGWEGMYDTMPDRDITVTAKLSKAVSVHGRVTSGDSALSDAKVYVNGERQAFTDENGEFAFTYGEGEACVTIVKDYCKAVNASFSGDSCDMGEIALDKLSTYVDSFDVELKAADVSGVITDEDSEYVKTEGNAVLAELNITKSDDSAFYSFSDLKYDNYSQCLTADVEMVKTRIGAENSCQNVAVADKLSMMKLEIPLQYRGMSDYAVLREADGSFDILTEEPDADGEYITFDETCVTVYFKKSAVYSVISKKETKSGGKYIAREITQETVENINVEVISPKDAGDDAFLYVAFYDADGRLIKACRRSEISVDNIFDAVPGTVEIKAFVWNEGFNPLT